MLYRANKISKISQITGQTSKNLVNNNYGFALLETAVSIVALGSILITSHNLRLNQQQVGEIIANTKQNQEVVSNYYQANGTLPDSDTKLSELTNNNPFIQQVIINEFGEIVITLSNNNDAIYEPLKGKTIILEPKPKQNGAISWNCNQGSLENIYKPKYCLIEQYQNIKKDNSNFKSDEELLDFVIDNKLI